MLLARCDFCMNALDDSIFLTYGKGLKFPSGKIINLIMKYQILVIYLLVTKLTTQEELLEIFKYRH